MSQWISHRLSPDDWGMSPSINDACLDLAALGLVHTISVCVKRPYFFHRLDDLIEMQKCEKAKVAIHLDLDHSNCYLPWHCLWIPTSALKRELESQMAAAKDAGLRVESVNGHRHIHLYPGPLSLVRIWGLPLRLPSDRAHRASYYGGVAAALAFRANWRRAGYLRADDLATVREFSEKLSGFSELLCHPAREDDFSRITFTDSLRGERVQEYRSIFRILGEMNG